MQVSADLSQIRQIVNDAYKILITISKESSEDQRIAQRILGEALTAKGKKVLTSPTDDSGRFEKVPERSVTFRFGYQGEKIERLQYRIGDKEVELRFTPFANQIKQEDINIEYPLFDFDLLISVGVSAIEQLPTEVVSYALDWEKITSINIDNNSENSMWGKLNVVLPDVTLYSLLVAMVCQEVQLDIGSQWKQMILSQTKEKLPQIGNASPRLLRMVADLLET